MKKIFAITFILAFAFSMFVSSPKTTEAKSAYYKSASSGRFVSKSSYKSSPKTTYRSYRR